MKPRTVTQLVVLLAALVVLSSAAYQVHEVNQVIITQFGNPIGDPVTEPGLHFKVPFIQKANYFREAVPGMGRQPEPSAHERQAVHLGRYLRPLAHRRSAEVLPAAAGRARRAVQTR